MVFVTGGRRFSQGTSADREIQRTLMEVCPCLFASGCCFLVRSCVGASFSALSLNSTRGLVASLRMCGWRCPVSSRLFSHVPWRQFSNSLLPLFLPRLPCSYSPSLISSLSSPSPSLCCPVAESVGRVRHTGQSEDGHGHESTGRARPRTAATWTTG